MAMWLERSPIFLKNDLSSRNTMRHCETDSFFKKIGDLSNHIAIAGVLLHRARRTGHMHQDDSGSRSGNHIDHSGVAL